jgi:hypothetical protein
MKNPSCKVLALLLFCLVLLGPACKNGDVDVAFVISSAEGSVYYSAYSNQTYITFSCGVSNQGEVPGLIVSWKMIFKSGGRDLLEINSENCAQYRMYARKEIPIKPYSVSEIYGESLPAVEGDLFPNENPDNMDISVAIRDDNANQMVLHGNAPITYAQ